MNADGLGFWGAVIAMAVITYLTRALPFMPVSYTHLTLPTKRIV